jgi:hypothetical protein
MRERWEVERYLGLAGSAMFALAALAFGLELLFLGLVLSDGDIRPEGFRDQSIFVLNLAGTYVTIAAVFLVAGVAMRVAGAIYGGAGAQDDDDLDEDEADDEDGEPQTFDKASRPPLGAVDDSTWADGDGENGRA